jgi:hypothetical protein
VLYKKRKESSREKKKKKNPYVPIMNNRRDEYSRSRDIMEAGNEKKGVETRKRKKKESSPS